MKYFLTIDRGVYFNQDRFKKIELSKINVNLNKEDNLEEIYEFTTTFENPSLLKSFLNKQSLLNAKDMFFDLVITYENNPVHLLAVAYSSDKKYFNLRNLEQIIYSFIAKPERLRILAKYYSNYKYLANELLSFRSFVVNPYADYKLYDVIRRFVEKICFKVVNGKKVKNYSEIYRLCMLVSKLDNPKNIKSSSKSSENQMQDFVKTENDNLANLYLDDEQLRLF